MMRIINFMVLLGVLSGCGPTPTVEGEVLSSRELGQGIIEHLVQTDSSQIPYYILRTNKNNLRQGAKIVLELPVKFKDSHP